MRGYRLGATLFEAPAAKSAVLVMPATDTGWRRND